MMVYLPCRNWKRLSSGKPFVYGFAQVGVQDRGIGLGVQSGLPDKLREGQGGRPGECRQPDEDTLQQAGQ